MDWFRELVRWQTAKVPMDDNLATNTDGKARVQDREHRRERYQDLIAYLTAQKTRARLRGARADRFCHCTFKTKRGGHETRSFETRCRSTFRPRAGLPCGSRSRPGSRSCTGPCTRPQGPVVSLSEFLAPVKNAVAAENGGLAHPQVPFAKLRGDVIARGLTKIRALDRSAGLVPVRGRAGRGRERDRAPAPAWEALLVVGVRS